MLLVIDIFAHIQVFFIDTSGALCSRSSGHAIDIEGMFPMYYLLVLSSSIRAHTTVEERLVLRHRRPVSHPFPNAYSHPLPRFSYDPENKRINVTFAFDPAYPTSATRATAMSTWKEKVFYMTSIPMRKPRTLIDNASELLTSAITAPLSFLGGYASPTSARPVDVFDSGDIDLREDEILETERSEEGEVDDSPERHRFVRVVGITKEEEQAVGEKANARRQWVVTPLRSTKNRTVQ